MHCMVRRATTTSTTATTMLVAFASATSRSTRRRTFYHICPGRTHEARKPHNRSTFSSSSAARRPASTASSGSAGDGCVIPMATNELPQPPPLHILGAGSIGLLWATLIRQTYPSYPVQVLLTPRHASKLQKKHAKSSKKFVVKVCVQESFEQLGKTSPKAVRIGPPRVVDVPARLVTEYQDPQCRYTISNLLVTTKAFQAKSAIESIQHCFSCYSNNNRQQHPTTKTRVLLLCNGALAVEEELNRHFGGNGSLATDGTGRPVLHLGWTSHGAYRTTGGDASDSNAGDGDDDDDEFLHLVHAGFGQTSIQGCPDLAPVFLNCHNVSSEEMRRQLWMKLAANCVINPLTALYSCRNGELLEMLEGETASGDSNDDVPSLMRQVIEELVHVAKVQEDYDFPVERVSDFVRQVMVDTASNQSSMLQDVLAERPTEIDYINGYLVEQGRAFGVDCPANELLCQRIKGVTSSVK